MTRNSLCTDISGQISYEDEEDQDEDFVVSEESENESDASESSDASDESENSTEEQEKENEENCNVIGLSVGIDRKGLLQVLAGDDTPFENEEIYSESEISNVFSDEEDESEFLANQVEFSTVKDAQDSAITEDSRHDVLRKVGAYDPKTGTALISEANHLEDGAQVDGTRDTRGNKENESIVSKNLSKAQGNEEKIDNHKEADKARKLIQEPRKELTVNTTASTMSPIGNQGSSRRSADEDFVPIAQRTRANVSLLNVPMEELEAALMKAPDEPLLNWGIDDADEYERFLHSLRFDNPSSLQNNGDLDQMVGARGKSEDDDAASVSLFNSDYDDSEDEDFLLQFRREFGLDAKGNASKKYKNGVKRKRDPISSRESCKIRTQLRRSARIASNGQRPNYFARWTERQMWQRAQAIQQLSSYAGLTQLADLAAALGNQNSRTQGIILPSEPINCLGEESKRVVWTAPAPKIMRRQNNFPGANASISSDEVLVIGGMVHPEQYRPLHRLVHSHIQLLIQTLILGIITHNNDAVKESQDMLYEFGQFVSSQTMIRMAHNTPPYYSQILGVALIDHRHQIPKQLYQPINRCEDNVFEHIFGARDQQCQFPFLWVPQDPSPAYSVADCALLRLTPPLLDAIFGSESFLKYRSKEAREGNSSMNGCRSYGNAKQVKKDFHKHELWSSLPKDIAVIVHRLEHYLDPRLEPMAPNFNTTIQMIFSPAEDELLAWGIRKYCYDWKKIRKEFMPCKTETQLFNRKKNRTSGRCGDNVIKQATNLITGPLTEAEIRLLTKATQYYSSKQSRRWEIIVRDHIPYRNPSVLAMLWSEYLKNGQQSLQPTLMEQKERHDAHTSGIPHSETHCAHFVMPPAVSHLSRPFNGFQTSASLDQNIDDNTARIEKVGNNIATVNQEKPSRTLENKNVMRHAEPTHSGSFHVPPCDNYLLEKDGKQNLENRKKNCNEKNAPSKDTSNGGIMISPWTADLDKTILKTALTSGGKLNSVEAENLALKHNVSIDKLVERSEVLVQRFIEKANRKIHNNS